MQSIRLLFARPISDYSLFGCFTFATLGVCFVIYGAIYAGRHDDAVKYGFRHFLPTLFLLAAFGFMVGVNPSDSSDFLFAPPASAFMSTAEEHDSAQCRRIVRIGGVSTLLVLGIFFAVMFYSLDWAEYSPPVVCPSNKTTSSPAPSSQGSVVLRHDATPTPKHSPSCTPQSAVKSHSDLPGSMLLLGCASLVLSITLRWTSISAYVGEVRAAEEASGVA